MTRTAKIWLIVALVAAVLLLCCVVTVAAAVFFSGVFNMGDIADVARGPGSPYVTLANYERVQIGMTYAEVAAIFRVPGVRTAQIELAGERLDFYTWKDMANGQATITFKNGLVTAKSENELK